MAVRSNFWLLLLLVFLCSCVAMGTDAADNGDSKNPAEKENGEDKAENREKRSREEIMFGNQQNKPNGLVDDIMALPDRAEDGDSAGANTDEAAKNATTDKHALGTEEQKLEDAFKDDDKEDKKKDDFDQYADDELIEGNSYDNWYSNPQAPPETLPYILSPQLQELPETDDDSASLYNQEMYRRKRQLLGHPLQMRKRSLRSPLGQMVARGRRLPRRSMRLKRQVDVDDLLSFLGNIDSNNPRYFDDQIQNNLNQQIQDMAQPELRYPYNLMRPGDDEDEEGDAEQDILGASRFLENEYAAPYRAMPETEGPAIPEWMVRHPPQVFSVSRRSAPGFYPLDYRFMPAATYRKRSPRGRWMPGGGAGNVIEDEDTDYGKWGRIVQVPEAYASADDVARLYALANLMSDSEDGQTRIRRRAV